MSTADTSRKWSIPVVFVQIADCICQFGMKDKDNNLAND